MTNIILCSIPSIIGEGLCYFMSLSKMETFITAKTEGLK